MRKIMIPIVMGFICTVSTATAGNIEWCIVHVFYADLSCSCNVLLDHYKPFLLLWSERLAGLLLC